MSRIIFFLWAEPEGASGAPWICGRMRAIRGASVMGRTQQKSSLTDQHAKRIAAAIAKGRPPAFTPDLDQYLEQSPREVFAALEGASLHMPPAGKDETLAFGYLFLLQALLERLRYRTDRGFLEASRLIADFQTEVAAQARAGRIDERMFAYLAGALHQSKIPASPELSAAFGRPLADGDEDGPSAADVTAALAGLLQACGGDPFAVIGAFAEFGHAMPGETRCTLAAGLALSDAPGVRAAAVLFLLDGDAEVRRAAARALVQVAPSLSPTDVRRLVTMRNWRPEDERSAVDAVIRKAREAGIESARWEAGSTEAILASTVDGAATQGFLLVSPAARKKRLSSILTKACVADAWSGEPETRRQIDAAIESTDMGAAMLPVSRAYLDRVVAHHLALGIERGDVPPPGLLQ